MKYSTRMFDMTNDSGLFRAREELEEQEGAYPIGGNRFASPSGDWVPLYEGKMVQAFDHRAANIVVNPENQHRPAQPVPATPEQHRNADWLPDPQYWVPADCETSFLTVRDKLGFLAFKDVTALRQMCRSMIAALDPNSSGVGNKAPHCPRQTGNLPLVTAMPGCWWPTFNATVRSIIVARQKDSGPDT